MKLRTLAASIALAASASTGATFALSASTPADAATTTISTSTTTKVMVSSRCYVDYTKTTTWYYHSAGHGWKRYLTPKVTTTKSPEHCYAR